MKNILIITSISLFLYLSVYFILRKVDTTNYSKIVVTYQGLGYRDYILEKPDVDVKLESGTHDLGSRSYLMRLFMPIEIIEMKLKYKLRHY
jgi:hypothetical protein